MKRLVVSALAGAMVLGAVTASVALPMDARAAKKQLFSGKRINIEQVEAPGLTPDTQMQVESLLGALTNPQIAASFKAYGYYGAIAVVPDMGISEKTMSISAKLHNPEAAQAVALQACNDVRPEESTACTIVALILPKKYKPREFSLSQEATDRFRKTWKKGDGPKYLAYSPGTHAWVIAKGAGADTVALERCNAQASEVAEPDCMIAIAEE